MYSNLSGNIRKVLKTFIQHIEAIQIA